MTEKHRTKHLVSSFASDSTINTADSVPASQDQIEQVVQNSGLKRIH